MSLDSLILKTFRQIEVLREKSIDIVICNEVCYHDDECMCKHTYRQKRTFLFSNEEEESFSPQCFAIHRCECPSS
jgi:hypothetical protein